MKAYIEAQGSLLVMRIMETLQRPNRGGGMRGKIRTFSYKSRLRLMRFMARLKMAGVRATFMTLTFKGYPTNEVAKMALHAFLQRVVRKFPTASAVWRMEYQQRGSIHFHLLWFNLPYWDWKEILEAWKACSRQRVARIDVQLIRSRKGVMSYVSKYIAKVEKRSGITFLVHVPYLHAGRKYKKGRFWGYHNKKALPLGEKVAGVLTDSKTIKRLAASAWEMIGQDTRFGSISFNLFHDKAFALACRNIEAGGVYTDEYTWSRQFTEREYRDHAYIAQRFSDSDFRNDYVKHKPDHARSRSVRSIQPCISGWVSRSSFVSRLDVSHA